jgi:hypothetical protein
MPVNGSYDLQCVLLSITEPETPPVRLNLSFDSTRSIRLNEDMEFLTLSLSSSSLPSLHPSTKTFAYLRRMSISILISQSIFYFSCCCCCRCCYSRFFNQISSMAKNRRHLETTQWSNSVSLCVFLSSSTDTIIFHTVNVIRVERLELIDLITISSRTSHFTIVDRSPNILIRIFLYGKISTIDQIIRMT